MSSPIIRFYKPADLQAVINLFKEAVVAINSRDYSSEQIGVWIDIDPAVWQKKFESNIAFIAKIDTTIVGFADMSYEGYLDRLYVHKDYQGRWVSFYLFKAIEKAARDLGLSKIITDCSITAKGPAERMGFSVIREQVVERRGMRFINYHMEKMLI